MKKSIRSSSKARKSLTRVFGKISEARVRRFKTRFFFGFIVLAIVAFLVVLAQLRLEQLERRLTQLQRVCQNVTAFLDMPSFRLPVYVFDVPSIAQPSENFHASASLIAPEKQNVLDIVQKYFDSYNAKDFKTACGLLSDKKCKAESQVDLRRFAQEHGKMVLGYQNVNTWIPDNTENFPKDIVCVQYSYQYKDSRKIIERMSFYVKDGEITNRVCEMKIVEGKGKTSCPLLAKRKFCGE